MAVNGKVRCTVYLDPENSMLVRDFLDSSRRMPGWSEFLDMVVGDFAKRIRDMEEQGHIEELIEEWMIHD